MVSNTNDLYQIMNNNNMVGCPVAVFSKLPPVCDILVIF